MRAGAGGKIPQPQERMALFFPSLSPGGSVLFPEIYLGDSVLFPDVSAPALNLRAPAGAPSNPQALTASPEFAYLSFPFVFLFVSLFAFFPFAHCDLHLHCAKTAFVSLSPFFANARARSVPLSSPPLHFPDFRFSVFLRFPGFLYLLYFLYVPDSPKSDLKSHSLHVPALLGSFPQALSCNPLPGSQRYTYHNL